MCFWIYYHLERINIQFRSNGKRQLSIFGPSRFRITLDSPLQHFGRVRFSGTDLCGCILRCLGSFLLVNSKCAHSKHAQWGLLCILSVSWNGDQCSVSRISDGLHTCRDKFGDFFQVTCLVLVYVWQKGPFNTMLCFVSECLKIEDLNRDTLGGVLFRRPHKDIFG